MAENGPFRGNAAPGERVIPAADNRAFIKDCCQSCGKPLPSFAFVESDHDVALKCDCTPQPDVFTLILAELKAIRELLEAASEGGQAISLSHESAQ